MCGLQVRGGCSPLEREKAALAGVEGSEKTRNSSSSSVSTQIFSSQVSVSSDTRAVTLAKETCGGCTFYLLCSSATLAIAL